ncbi:MAG: hypothetical protein WCF84_26545 [Anaerolineae bacterium]
MLRHTHTTRNRIRALFVSSILFLLMAFAFAACNSTAAGPTDAPVTLEPTRVARPAGTTAVAATLAPGQVPTSTPVLYDAEGNPIPPVPQAKPLLMKSPAYSVQAFLWYRVEQADRDLTLIQNMGFSWVKQEFAWRDMEGAGKGAFDWSHSDQVIIAANRKKLDLLARIDNSPDWAAPGCFSVEKSTMGPPAKTQDWVDFLKAFATRYKQRVRAYEIWNEPNLSREWCNRPPSPSEYAKFLQASYQAIKSVDPNAMIISGGLTPTTCCSDGGQAMPDGLFFQKMYEAMGKKSDGYFDVLGVHAAGFKAEPEADPGVVAQDPVLTNNDPSSPDLKRIYSFRHVEDIRKIMVQYGDTNKQIVITEFGWTSDQVNPAYAWFRVDENTKADRIVRAYQYAKAHWAPWIGAMSLIYIASPDWTNKDEKYWWAITNPDGTTRPAYDALKAMPK